MPTSSTEPTIAGAIPPPDSPNSAGPLVKKSRLSAEMPRLPTDQTRIPSTAIAAVAAAIAASLGDAVRRAAAAASGPSP